jgi:hypothetical protein
MENENAMRRAYPHSFAGERAAPFRAIPCVPMDSACRPAHQIIRSSFEEAVFVPFANHAFPKIRPLTVSRDESLFVAPSPYPFTSMKHGGGRCTPLGGEKCFFSHALFS